MFSFSNSQEGRKNSTSHSTCPKDVLRKTYYNLYRHPERYQGVVSCDDHDKRKAPKKRKMKNIKRKRKNNHSQFGQKNSFQRTKSNTTQEVQKNLAMKSVRTGDISKKRFIATSNEELSKLMLLNNGSDWKNSRKVPSDEQIKEVTENNTKDKNETRHLVPYETIIEMLIKRLSESDEDSPETEGSYLSSLEAQRTKGIMKKKKKQKKRKMHKNRKIRSRKKNYRLPVSAPQNHQSLNVSAPPHPNNNEQNSETHLHVYLSHPKNFLNLTNISDQKHVENGKKRLDKEKAPQLLPPTRLEGSGDQQSTMTYSNIHLRQDQHHLSASSKLRTGLNPSEVEYQFSSMANMSGDKKMADAFSGHLILSSNNESFLSPNHTPLQSSNNKIPVSNATQGTTRLSSTLMQIGLPLQKYNPKDDTSKHSGHTTSEVQGNDWGNRNASFFEVSDKIRERKQRRKNKWRNKSRRPIKKQQKIEHFLQEMISKEINHNIQDINKEKIHVTSTKEPSELNEDHANTKSLLSFLPYIQTANVTSMLQPAKNLQPSTNTYSTLLISPHHEMPRLDMEYKRKIQNYSKVSN